MRFITPQIARRSAADCACALAALLQPDGRFIYRYLLGQPRVNKGYYDTVRHAASVWYLIDADLALGTAESIRKAAVSSADHMIERFLVPYAGEDMLGLLSEGFVKLGGSGLAIVALCRLWDATSDQRYLNLAVRIGRFILAQEQDSGDFVQVRNYPLGVVHPARDPFSAGQAIMGLVYLFERTGEPTLLNAAQRYTHFLDKAGYGVKTHSHWMLYALDKVYEAAPSPGILAYADRVATGMLNNTTYRKQGLSTPIACFTEGLLAYDRLLAKSGLSSIEPKRTTTMRAVRQNLSLLLKYRREGGVYVAGDKDPEVRIDYIVHPGCCFLGYATDQT